MRDWCWKFYEGMQRILCPWTSWTRRGPCSRPALLALEGTRPERYAYGSMGPSLERLSGSPKVDSVVSMGGSDR